MRVRLIRPEFWQDVRMAELTAGARLTYIGLWCLADDAGYLEWQPRQIAALLYPHASPSQRLRTVEGHLTTLTGKGRVRVLDCGEHAVIPSLPDHRIKGGKLLFTIEKKHERRCLSVPVHTGDGRVRTSNVSVSSSSSGSVSESVSGPAGDGLSAATEEDLDGLRSLIAITTDPGLRNRYAATLERMEAKRVH